MRIKTSFMLAIAAMLYLGAIRAEAATEMPAIFPGSAWNMTGNTAPVEKGNVMGSSYAEQGITIYRTETFSVVPYVSLGLTLDRDGYDWNNRLLAVGGVKFVKNFENGIVSLGGGYAKEHRFKSGARADGGFLKADYWFGWQGSDELFPGNSWGVIGNISPIERGNIIAAIYAQQGVRIMEVKGFPLIPFVEATVTRDSDRYDWDNRELYGGGVKIMTNSPSYVGEVGIMHLNEHRPLSGIYANCLTIFVKFWLGWNPKL